jgi:predicted XRE-type DNA-binding protein
MSFWVDPVPALKRRVADEILVLLEGWTQEYAADFLGARQPRMSELRRGRLDRFTLDRLVRYLSRLHRDIEIVTTKRPDLSVLEHRDPRLEELNRTGSLDAHSRPEGEG